MTDVFISYSRRNTPFARKLIERLTLKGKDAWVDWEGIPLTSPNWWVEIQRGIEAADSFIFIMSPDSMESVVCNMELDYALELEKRVVPIVFLDVNSSSAFASIADFDPDPAMEERLQGKDPLLIARENWQQLSHINWVFFRESDDFEEAFEALVSAVETDLDYVRAHTRYLTRANEWERENRRDDLLLFGEEIARAETWLEKARTFAAAKEAAADDKVVAVVNPTAKPVQVDYIEGSRRAANRRRRQVLAAQASIGILIVVIIGGLILASSIVSQTQQEVRDVEATSDQNVAQANALVADASTQVFNANAELTAVPPTLTQVGEQIIAAQAEAATAEGQAAAANAELTAVPPTLTQVSGLVVTAEGQAAAAGTQVAVANAELTAVPPTLTQVGVQVAAARAEAAAAEGQAAAAGTQVFNANATLTPIPPTLTRAAELQLEAETVRDLSTAFSSVLLDPNLNQVQVLDRLNDLVATYSEFPQAYDQRAAVLYQLDEFGAALADMNRALELSAGNSELQAAYYLFRSVIYDAMDNLEAALADLDTAVSLSPDDPSIYFVRATYNARNGNAAGALDDYNQAIALYPFDPIYFLERGALHVQRGDLESAVADYSQAAELDPNEALAYFELGYAYYRLSPVGSEAIILDNWQQAQELEFELPDYAQEFVDSGGVFSDEFAPEALSVVGIAQVGDNNRELVVGTTDFWSVEANAGDRLTLTVTADWDTTLTLRSPFDDELAFNDDDNGLPNSSNSRVIEVYMPVNGLYRVGVRGYDDIVGGLYTLTVTQDIIGGERVVGDAIQPGETTGRLDEAERAYWAFEAQAGDVISVTVTGDFDTTLTIITPEGEVLAFNDESDELPNPSNSLLRRVEFPEAGTYTIMVAGYNTDNFGDYTLTIEQNP